MSKRDEIARVKDPRDEVAQALINNDASRAAANRSPTKKAVRKRTNSTRLSSVRTKCDIPVSDSNEPALRNSESAWRALGRCRCS
jgi:hypothetical protein